MMFDNMSSSKAEEEAVVVTGITSVLSGDGIERKFTLRSHTSQGILQDFNSDSTFRDIFASMSLIRMKADAIQKIKDAAVDAGGAADRTTTAAAAVCCVFCARSCCRRADDQVGDSSDVGDEIIEVNKEAETTENEIRICLSTHVVCPDLNCRFLHRVKLIPLNQQLFPHRLMMFIKQRTMGHCAWSHNGKVFTIANRIMFSMTTLPLHFPMMTYTDFIQELKDWGFQVSVYSQGADFSHPSFHRDDPIKCFDIKSKPTDHNPPQYTISQEQQAITGISPHLILAANMPNAVIANKMVSMGAGLMSSSSLERKVPSTSPTQLPKKQAKKKSSSKKKAASAVEAAHDYDPNHQPMKPVLFFDSLRSVLDNEKTNHIISWTESGQSFCIHN